MVYVSGDCPEQISERHVATKTILKESISSDSSATGRFQIQWNRLLRSVIFSFCCCLLILRASAQDLVFVCPMDPEVRSATPGKCPRCGMTLVANLPDPVEYPMEFRAEPRQIPAQTEITLSFRILDPQSHQPVTRFNIVHEKLFHLFLVSQDLTYFSHEHPLLTPDGWFTLKTRLPRPGTYRLLADFDPIEGTPQLSARTFLDSRIYRTSRDGDPAFDSRSRAAEKRERHRKIRTEPQEPVAGKKTMIFLTIEPSDGLEKYIGAWAHVLSVSDDMIDMIHTHPTTADGGAEMQINVFFPRARPYRVWVQLQRNGVVNTVAFTVPVRNL